jgi:hypothetical protein
MGVCMDTVHKHMREWMLECFIEEYDQEQIQNFNHRQLEKHVDLYFDGGLDAFIECVGNV